MAVLNPLDMTGKTVLVTGASSGIGRETAIVLSQLGARLVLVARNQERLEKTRQQLDGTGHVVEVCDLGNYEGIPGWMKTLTTTTGSLDGLVHSAGIQVTAPLKVMKAQQVEQLWQVNVAASLWLAKGFRQRGVNRAGGSIVLLASVAGSVGMAALSAYCASKGAVLALTRSLAMELARENIRVNCVAPGFIKSEMMQEAAQTLPPEKYDETLRDYPLGLGETTDVANAVAYLLSSAARWVTGTTLVVDGGYTAH